MVRSKKKFRRTIAHVQASDLPATPAPRTLEEAVEQIKKSNQEIIDKVNAQLDEFLKSKGVLH